MDESKVVLSEKHIPTVWYNLLADLPFSAPPALNPATGRPLSAKDLHTIFPLSLIRQEMGRQKEVAIPAAVRDIYRLWRPTPLKRALRLEKYLGTKARIYYKDESVSPTGSHKINTSIAQAYFNKKEGIRRLTTETGAGQWGAALSFACNVFSLKCMIYMVKVSYNQKPFRRSLMKIWGADVVASPSKTTVCGRAILKEYPGCRGSLGVAISEAVEDAAGRKDTNYALGSVLNHVLLHQTVIGQEAKEQLKLIGETPDFVIGCVGGGSNFGGLAFPFVADKLRRRPEMRIIAVEPSACPTLTRGLYEYDFGDTASLTPLLKMFTLGHKFMPPSIHAGGLRYHGCSPLVSLLCRKKIAEARSYPQLEVFKAALVFARTEGIVPAPETAHAVKAAIDAAKTAPKGACVLFNFSGNGFLDLASYDKFLGGELKNFSHPAAEIRRSLKNLPAVCLTE
ncbi:MAG: TrpB-like pyridoxal phosphate-dependent enzyme [Candidatus Omnitrophota bacterium]|jgi:tryptophan synthase beta chain